MSAARTPEYRTLELDTSNEMMAYDSRMGFGRDGQAREHIRRAGSGRRLMGQMMCDAGEFSYAAEDWLSAAMCYQLAGDTGAMAEAVARVRELADAGRIPANRLDLWGALSEREAELRTRAVAAPANGSAPAPADPVPAPRP